MSDRPLGKDRLGAGSDRIRKRLLIVGGYAVAASLWILISDSLLDVGPSDAMRLSDGVQTVKGLLFVLVTAGGLYWLMLRAARELGAVEAAQGRYEERFSSIFNNVHDLAMLVLSPDGRIVDCNRASTSILGWSAGELRAADVASLCVDDDGAQGWIDRFIAEAAETAHAGHDFWHRRKDGSRFWANVSLSRLSDGSGRPSGFVMVIRDATERRRAEDLLHASEERLRESERRTRLMMDSSVDGIITIDEHGIIENFSGAAARIFGYPAEEMVGKNVSVLMPEPDRGRHDDYLRRYLETGEKRIIGLGREVEGLRSDGTVFPMDLAVTEVSFGRGQRRFVGTVRDLTERRRIEAQLRQAQKMEAVGQLTGGLAHDFNNLLSVTMGCAEMLQDRLAGDPQGIRLSMAIIDAAKRGADLTGRLLAISRRQALQPVSVDISELMLGLHDLLARTLGEEIDVAMSLPKGLPEAIADPAQIENALLNLAINARDAMPAGGTLSISVDIARLDEAYVRQSPDATPGDYVVIAVSDTGEGMPKEVLDHAFDPFFTTKPIGKGTGLGLSMVYGFAKQSGGHAKIYSEPGIGTTVRLYLPQADALARHAAAAPVQAERELPTGTESILLVEDDTMVRRYVADQLASLGYAVSMAGDGPSALAEIRSGKAFDVLFTDVVMPGGMSGRELAEKALELRPEIKVLFTTGYTEDVMVLQGKLAAGTDLLSKPFGRAALARKLRAVIDG